MALGMEGVLDNTFAKLLARLKAWIYSASQHLSSATSWFTHPGRMFFDIHCERDDVVRGGSIIT